MEGVVEESCKVNSVVKEYKEVPIAKWDSIDETSLIVVVEDPNTSEFSDIRNAEASCMLFLPWSLNASVVATPNDNTAAEIIIGFLMFV